MNAGGMQLWAGILGASGVGIGAFGAHALKATLEANGRAPTFQTGVQVRVPPLAPSCAASNLPLLTLLSFADPGPATVPPAARRGAAGALWRDQGRRALGRGKVLDLRHRALLGLALRPRLYVARQRPCRLLLAVPEG